MRTHKVTAFAALTGQTIVSIDGLVKESDKVTIRTKEGNTYEMYHEQDCCEYVRLEDVCGDISDIIGLPLLRADEVDSCGDGSRDDSNTWTFYRLDTRKGSVCIRWLGESNGYYSESVRFFLVVKDQ